MQAPFKNPSVWVNRLKASVAVVIVLKAWFLTIGFIFGFLPELLFETFDPIIGVRDTLRIEGKIILDVILWPFDHQTQKALSEKLSSLARFTGSVSEALDVEKKIVSGNMPVLSLVGDKYTEDELNALCPNFKQAAPDTLKSDIEAFFESNRAGKVALVAHNDGAYYLLELPTRAAKISVSEVQAIATAYHVHVIPLSCDSVNFSPFGIIGTPRTTSFVARLRLAKAASSMPEIAAALGVKSENLGAIEDKFTLRVKTPSAIGHIARVGGSLFFWWDAWKRHEDLKNLVNIPLFPLSYPALHELVDFESHSASQTRSWRYHTPSGLSESVLDGQHGPPSSFESEFSGNRSDGDEESYYVK
jgi:hypothetical protein